MGSEPIQIRWIKVGIIAGLCASIVYPLLVFAPLPFILTATLAGLLGPLIGFASFGLRALLQLFEDSVASTLAALSNLIAGAFFSAMALVQLAVRSRAPVGAGEADLVGVWLGLDVAWDIYIGLGTVLFASVMVRHPRFRWPFAVTGLTLGFLELALNLATFPTPPAEAGLFDIGPLVGLWYLATTLQAWRSLGWARARVPSSG